MLYTHIGRDMYRSDLKMSENLVVAKVGITETTYFEKPAHSCIRYVEDPTMLCSVRKSKYQRGTNHVVPLSSPS